MRVTVKPKQVTVIRHLAFEDLGTLAPVLSQRGYHITYVEAGKDPLHNFDPESPDLLVILGGPIGVYDQNDYSFLLDELRILQSRLQADLPVLGICLGAQLIASALGAKVYPGTQGKEMGWAPISLSDAGQQSALKCLDLQSVLHWHGDTFDLPPACVRLASSSLYQNQAFSYQYNCLALQFHPEVTISGLEQWFIGHSCEINHTPNVTVTDLRRDTERDGENLQQKAVQFWQEWLDHLTYSTQSQHPTSIPQTA